MSKNKCLNCNELEEKIILATKNPHYSYNPTLSFIKELISQNKIVFHSGDCDLNDIDELMSQEKLFSISHYFQCNVCKRFFMIGLCVRGTPAFKVFET